MELNETQLYELAKQGAEFIIRNNDRIFEHDINGFTSVDCLYVNYLNDNRFSFLQRQEETKYIFMYFRIITRNGKFWNAQQVNVLIVKTGEIIEIDKRII